MDISSIQNTATQAAKFARTQDSDEVSSGAHGAATKAAVSAQNDVASFHDAAQESIEMTAARVAMRNVDTLDDARRAEIQARLSTGFYTQPDVIESVSAAMAEALSAEALTPEALTPNQGSKTD